MRFDLQIPLLVVEEPDECEFTLMAAAVPRPGELIELPPMRERGERRYSRVRVEAVEHQVIIGEPSRLRVVVHLASDPGIVARRPV